MKTVTMYTMTTCSYCKQAKELLSTYHVVPEEIQIDVPPSDMPKRIHEMRERTGRQSVPQIIIGDTHVGGYDDLKALHDAGTLSQMLGQ